jgi:RNA polymerase sigma factor (sigma-70 family)
MQENQYSQNLLDFLESVGPRVRSLLARSHIPSADADDIFQDATLSLIQQWDSIHNAEAWLLAVVKFRCSVYIRRQVRWQRLMHPMDPIDLQAVAKPIDPPQTHRDICQDVGKLTRSLDQDEQLLLYHLFFQDLGRTKAAIQFGCHPANVPKVLRRILTRLKEAAYTITCL